MTAETETRLTAVQHARAEALRQARIVLATRNAIGGVSGTVDVTDVHSLAVFILDGGDPWLDNKAEPAPLRATSGWANGQIQEHANNAVRAALEDVREKFNDRHGDQGRMLCIGTLDKVIDEVKP